MTFNDLATDAYIKNGILAPGETLDPNLSEYAMREANRMLDQWNIQSLFIWTKPTYVFTLTSRPISTVLSADQFWYTIGPAGSLPDGSNPDFIAPRPTRLKRAVLIITSSNPPSRVQLDIWDELQWSDQTVQNLGTSPYPTAIYDDYADPFSNLFVWPYPQTTGNQLELLVPNQISRFATINDSFQMPSGYEDAFMQTLAERVIEGVREISATLQASASKARANVRSLNSRAPKISTTDSGMPGGKSSEGNFYNGWPNLGR